MALDPSDRADARGRADAHDALQEMKKAAVQLDAILQQLCAAQRTASDASDAFQSKRDEVDDDGFADTAEWSDKNQRSDAAAPSDALLQEATQQSRVQCTAAGFDSIESYFESIESTLAHARNRETAVRVALPPGASVLQHPSDAHSDDPKRQRELFASKTRGVAFHFAQDAGAVCASSSECAPFAGEFESEMPLEHVEARVQHELTTRDHRLPLSAATSIARGVSQFVLCQRAVTLAAVRSVFRDDEMRDNQVAEGLQWHQRSPVVQIVVDETEQAFEWGVQVTVAVHSIVQPQRQQADSVLDGPIVAATLQHSLFLPKTAYDSVARDGDTSHGSDCSGPIRSATELYLMREASSGSSDGASAAQVTDSATDPSVCPGSLAVTSETRARADARELPELLNVYMRGHFYDPSAAASATDTPPPAQHDARAFAKLQVQTPFPRTRIVEAACGRFHALLRNDLGMVFAFGHVVDGALGLGPLHDLGPQSFVTEPRLLTHFFDQLITIQSIACGGDLVVGSHSAAVATDGSVYTWGTGVALGNRSVRSHAEPQRIDIPRRQSDSALDSEASAPRIQSIACGGGFCVALAESGHAFAWGKWSDGRLGLGNVPILNQTSRKYGRRRQFQSLQLSPKQLGGRDSYERFAKVACGEAHCVALTRAGALVTWGRGAHGQLGLGSTKDALSPTLVTISDDRKLTWRDVAAGENWSMALDALGRVWTWGACGGPVLGTGATARAAVVTETILQHHYRVRKQPRSAATAPPPELRQLRWMRPQLVPSFSAHGVQIERLSAGRQHAAALSSTGDLYIWGDGDGFTSLPQLVHASVASGDDRSAAAPAAIGSEIVEYAVCGGDVVVAFTSGSFLARSMRTLYEQCMQLAAEHQQLEPPAARDAIAALGVDVALLVSGKRLFAHKLVLAKRSAVLRDLIVTEQRTPSAHLPGEALVLELLLPQLRHDVAAVLLEYMYTDNVSRMLDPQSYLVRDVLRAARMFELRELEHLCRSLVDTSSRSVVHPLNPLAPPLSLSKDSSLADQRSLTADLALALGDAAWSDLAVVAEGRAIPVHRCILTARSAYFRALLAFDARASDSQTQRREVHVDESFACTMRVLTFIYSDRVTQKRLDATDAGMDAQDRDDDATEELLEDLVAADKFGLVRFKRLCEHAVCVTQHNCLDVLAVADLVHAAHLKQVALAFLQTHLHVLAPKPAFTRFARAYPRLMDELLAHIRAETAAETTLRQWHCAVEHNLAQQREQDERDWDAAAASARAFPWLHLILASTFATLYLALMATHVHAHPFVPAINVVALCGLVGALLMEWI